jgi:DNA-binding FrmR family transcriptional regulator
MKSHLSNYGTGTAVPKRFSVSLIICSYHIFGCENMRKGTIITALVAFLFLMPIIPGVIALPENLSITTDQSSYHPGEVVKVTGIATAAGEVALTFKVGTRTINTVYPAADEDGKYQYSYSLLADPEIGTWTIEAKDSAAKTATTSFTVLKANPKVISEKLIGIAQTSQSLVEEQLGDSPPQAAKENYDEGVKALEEAQNLLTSEQYSASIQASLRAQKHFANALRILAIWHPPQTIDDEARLTNQIERAQKMYNSLKTLYDNVKGLSTDNSRSMETALADAQVDIKDANDKLAADNIPLAQTALTNALEHMKTVRTLLQEYALDTKKEQIISFIDKAEERIDKLEEAVNTLKARIGDTEADTLLQKLEKVRTALEGLRKLVTDDATLAELNTQMKAIQDAIGELHNTALKEALKEMDNMQAWIQLMKETRGIWMKRGMNTHDLDTKIHLGEDTLGQYISELTAGRKMGSRFPDIIQSFRDAFRNRGH